MLIQLKPLMLGLLQWPRIVFIWWCFASLSFFISSSKCSGLLEGIYFDEQPLRPSFRPFPAICKDCHAVATSTSNYCCTSSTPSTTTNQTTNWQMKNQPISSFSYKITNQPMTNNYCCTSSTLSTTNQLTNQASTNQCPTGGSVGYWVGSGYLLGTATSFSYKITNQPLTSNYCCTSSTPSTTTTQISN